MLPVLHVLLFFFHLQAGESREQEELGGMAQGKQKYISSTKFPHNLKFGACVNRYSY